MASEGAGNFLEKFGVRAAHNGWPIVLLKHGDKKPLNYPWTKRNFKPADIERMVRNGKRYGVGIRCGNIIGLDDDYEEDDAVTSDFIKALGELKDHFFPESMLRKGRPTRQPLRVIRLRGDEVFKSINVDKLQILATGRQFVAYNIHPVTDKPYVWTKEPGGPATVKLEDVPEYGKQTLIDFIKAVQILQETWGLSPGKSLDAIERIKKGDFKPSDLKGDQATVTAACEYVVNKPEWGWEDWNNNIMMPLWAASGGEDWGLELAHKLSEQSDAYDKETTDQRWEHIGRSPPNRIGVGTLLWQARQNGMPFRGPNDWDHYKVFLDRHEIYNTETKTWMERLVFNDFFADFKTKGHTPLQTFMKTRRDSQIFDTVVWDPALPTGEAVFDTRRVWNTCAMPTDYGEEGDIEPWLELMNNLYRDQTDIILKRMAFDVHYPHLKPQWHEFTISNHGYGKNTTKTPLRNWFGDMALSMNASGLEGSFTSFMVRRKHLEINELKSVDSKTFNKHKDMLASADPWFEVNEKFRRPYRVKNVVSCWLFSNEIDALSISPTERRLYVVHKRDKPLPLRRLKQIFHWVNDNWRKVIWHLRHKVIVDKSYGDLLPERTAAMMELVATAGRAHDRLRSLARGVTKDAIVFGLDDLHVHLIAADVHERPGLPVHKETLRKALMAEGAVRVRGGMPVRLNGGGLHRLWSFDTSLAEADAETIRGMWMASGKFKDVVND